MQQMTNQYQDLGGATPEDDYSAPGQSEDDESEDGGAPDPSVGINAAKTIAVAPRPVVGGKAAPQEPMGSVKSQGLAQPVVGDVDLQDGAGAIQEEDFSEEEIEQDPIETQREWIKEKIADRKGSMVQDVDALFNGESLSEEFRGKATVIFEAAVMSRVESIVEDVLAENDEVLTEAIQQIQEDLTGQVDEYLNYVVEEWMEENRLAIDTGLRAELVNDFIGGLKDLFTEHYIELPEEKVDVAEELAQQLVAMEEEAANREAELASLTEELNSVKKSKLIDLACEGLTQVQAGKMKSLAEGVEFTTEGDYNNKLAVIRENYFPTKVQVKSEVKAIQEASADEEQKEVVQAQGIMAHYVNAITKTAPKF